MPTERTQSRLSWNGLGEVAPQVRDSLIGRGAPYELVAECVGNRELTVFAHRPTSLREMFDETVSAHAEEIFLASRDRTWTFRQAADDVDALAALLAEEYGVGKGDRVAIVAANCPEYALAMWAILSVGAIVTSLNGWWTGAELSYGIQLTEPKLLLGDERRLARLPAEHTELGHRTSTLESVLAEARRMGHRPPATDIDEDTPAVILFTSGTTGRPKGATLTHRNIVNFAMSTKLGSALARALDPAAGTTQGATILASPMFHVSGMIAVLMTGGGLGARLVFPAPGRWNPSEYLDLTTTHRVSSWSGVPTQFWQLLRDPSVDDRDLSCVRAAGAGGAPFPPELVRAFAERMPWITLSNGYGMSETVGLGTRIGGQAMTANPTSVGPANVTVEVEVRDLDGSPLDDGDIGEIYLRTPSVFAGYWNNPAATADAVDDAGWYRTGDFGRIDHGLLFLESRRRDLILRGGENIYPVEVENRLIEHPDIDDAAVIGVDHPELGQEVKAYVVRRDGTTLTDRAVQLWVSEALASFKVPAYVEFRASLPYTETGKVMKHELEREHRSAHATSGS